MNYTEPDGLPHGGCLNEAANKFNIPLSDWMDLSTGINPAPWPVPMIPSRVWCRLPENNDGLELAASRYYGVSNFLAVAGSQAAIQCIPRLFLSNGFIKLRIGVLHPSYNEHAHAWREAGHQVISLTVDEIDNEIMNLDVLVLVNPNNPTGQLFNREKILEWYSKLQLRSGTLIIDEAFMDALSNSSLLELTDLQGFIVLRSIGKFFGIAGVRVGFVFAESVFLKQLKSMLGPWPIATPSRWVATQALKDIDWQTKTRFYLSQASEKMKKLLSENALAPTGGTHYFQWVIHKHAKTIYQRLAEQAILVRFFEKPCSIRFGLPATRQEQNRLEQALMNLGLNK